MAFTITRISATQNDLGGSGAGRNMDEANWEGSVGRYGLNWIVSGFGVTGVGTTTASVAAGTAVVNGHEIVVTGSDSVTVTATTYNRLWLKLTQDGNGDTTGVELEELTGTSPPTEPAVLLAEYRVGGTNISDIYARSNGSQIVTGSIDDTMASAYDGDIVLGFQPRAVLVHSDINSRSIWQADNFAIDLQGTGGPTVTIETFGFSLGTPVGLGVSETDTVFMAFA